MRFGKIARQGAFRLDDTILIIQETGATRAGYLQWVSVCDRGDTMPKTSRFYKLNDDGWNEVRFSRSLCFKVLKFKECVVRKYHADVFDAGIPAETPDLAFLSETCKLPKNGWWVHQPTRTWTRRPLCATSGPPSIGNGGSRVRLGEPIARKRSGISQRFAPEGRSQRHNRAKMVARHEL